MKRFFIPVLSALILGIGYFTALRIKSENRNKSVEICVNWEDTLRLISRERVPAGSFLERIKILGVGSVALKEETLGDLLDTGRAIAFDDSEIEKFKSLGLVPKELLKANLLWLKKESDDADKLINAMNLSLGGQERRLGIRKIGDYIVLEDTDRSWSEERQIKLGFNPAILKSLKDSDLFYVHLLRGKPSGTESGTGMSCWLAEVPSSGAEGESPLNDGSIGSVAQGSHPFALLENQTRPVKRDSLIYFPEKVVRAHTISPAEMRELTEELMKERWVRAVKERSVRFLYFRWNPDWGVEDNLNALRDVCQDLRSSGYRLSALAPFSAELPGIHYVRKPYPRFRLVLALVVCIAGPLTALLFAAGRRNIPFLDFPLLGVLARWLGSVFISMLAGLCIALLLPDTVYVSGLKVFRGVKAALLVPMALSTLVLFKPAQVLQFLKRKISVTDLMIFSVLILCLLEMVIRSGNFGNGAPSSLELDIRSLLERALGERPRFKEFLIGHPLMILGIYLSGVYGDDSRLSRFCLWAGTLLFVSILNSFCHLHTPIAVSLLRTLNGTLVGGFFGFVLILIFKMGYSHVKGERKTSPPFLKGD